MAVLAEVIIDTGAEVQCEQASTVITIVEA
jgi:hypothetical protein